MGSMQSLEHSLGLSVCDPEHFVDWYPNTSYLAYGVFQLDGSLHNWQYLFIIEGSLTGFIAILAWFWLPMGPGSAWFLTPEQRAFGASRIQIDGARYVQHTYGKDGLEKSTERLSRRDVIETAKD